MKPTAKQVRQRKLYVALGTVKGFNGFLINLEAVVKRADLPDYVRDSIDYNCHTLKQSLELAERVIRSSFATDRVNTLRNKKGQMPF